MSNLIRYRGKDYEAPFEVEQRFVKGKKRGVIEEHDWIVLHENAGTVDPDKFIRNRKWSPYCYHLVTGRDGKLIQLADLADRLWHASPLNKKALGYCTLNGYYRKLAVIGQKVIEGKWWTHGKTYAVPSDAQLKTASVAIPWLCCLLQIPQHSYPTEGLCSKRPKTQALNIQRGVIAHGDFSKHSDGRYILEHVMRTSAPEVTIAPSGPTVESVHFFEVLFAEGPPIAITMYANDTVEVIAARLDKALKFRRRKQAPCTIVGVTYD